MNALQTLIKSTHAFGKARIVRYKPLSVQHSRIGLSSGEANQQAEADFYKNKLFYLKFNKRQFIY